jgi:integrase
MYYYLYINYIEPDYQNIRILDITPDDIKRSIAKGVNVRGQHGLAKIRSTWRLLFQIARNKKILRYDPTIDIKLPKSKKVVKNPHKANISNEDLKKLAEYFIDYPGKGERSRYNSRKIGYALLVMHYLDLRPAEAFGLIISNYTGASLFVGPRASIDEGYVTKLNPPKTALSARAMKCGKPCQEAIDAAIAMNRAGEFIFGDYNGKIMDTSKVAAKIHNACQKLGYDFCNYDLRHLFASSLVNGDYGEKVDLKTVQSLLGHATGTMTLYYAASKQSNLDQALDLISADSSPKKNEETGKKGCTKSESKKR